MALITDITPETDCDRSPVAAATIAQQRQRHSGRRVRFHTLRPGTGRGPGPGLRSAEFPTISDCCLAERRSLIVLMHLAGPFGRLAALPLSLLRQVLVILVLSL